MEENGLVISVSYRRATGKRRGTCSRQVSLVFIPVQVETSFAIGQLVCDKKVATGSIHSQATCFFVCHVVILYDIARVGVQNDSVALRRAGDKAILDRVESASAETRQGGVPIRTVGEEGVDP